MWEIPPHKMTNIIKFRSGKTPSGLLAAALPKIATTAKSVALPKTAVALVGVNDNDGILKKTPAAQAAAVAAPQDAQGPPPWECGKCKYTLNCDSYRMCYSCGVPSERKNGGSSARTGSRHPNGVTVDIVGIIESDRGRSCEEHACCGDVLAEDVCVRLRREQILVPNRLGKKGAMKEEMAYTVNWVTDGQDRCRVGFLPRS